MKGLPFLIWNFIIIYPLVSKNYRETLKISAIIGRLPVCDGTGVEADWRRSCTYGRAPNAIDIS